MITNYLHSQPIVRQPRLVAPYSYTSLGLNIPEDAIDRKQFDIQFGSLERHKYRPAQDVQELLKNHAIVKEGQVLNSREIRDSFQFDVEACAEQGYPLTLVTIVCPPYESEQLHSRRNTGLFGSIEDDPLDHNFMFNYKIVLWDMFFLINELKRVADVDVEAKFIISDWAFKDARGILSGMKSMANIHKLMDAFKSSCSKFLIENLGDVDLEILGYRDVGLDMVLPLCMPMTPDDKEMFMINLQAQSFPGLSDVESMLMYALMEDYNSDMGQKLYKACTNTALWPKIEEYLKIFFSNTDIDDMKCTKSFVIDFLRLMRNTRDGRESEGFSIDMVKASFFDAIVKSYEYMILGRFLSGKYQSAWNFSWDTKFPASGHFYSKGGFKTFYLDPKLIPTPMRKLNAKINPF